MARLMDDMLKHGVVDKEHMEKIDIPFVVADDVTEHYFASSGQEEWYLEKDFPCLAPPWPFFWIETRAPKKIYSDEKGEHEWPVLNPQAWGLFMYGKETGNGWLVGGDLILSYHRKPPLPAGMRFYFEVDKKGVIIKETGVKHEIHIDLPSEEEKRQAALNAQMTTYFPLLLAICFMHCQNVSLTHVEPPKNLSRKRKKKTGHDLVKHYVLNIEPMKQVLHTEGNMGTVGLRRALHICRGHFKDYRHGQGLFGKHKGLYWFNMHAKGTQEKGRVEKEYRIKI